MKKYLTILVLLFVFFISICCETDSRAKLLDLEMKFQELKAEFKEAQTGRYKIYQNPIVRADQYLLDTVTGKVWGMRMDPKTKEQFWDRLEVMPSFLDLSPLEWEERKDNFVPWEKFEKKNKKAKEKENEVKKKN